MSKIKDPKLDENDMINKADYEVKTRDFLNNYGSQYGITNDMIGWNRSDPNSNGMITLGGQDFLAPDRLENGSSWNSNESVRSALDQWAKQRGIQSSTQKADLSNHGYDKDKYSTKIDGILDSILNAKPFSYDAQSDPSFQAYRDQYNRLGDRSLANTMSEASAMTGGRLNSWAVSAGHGAKAQYDQQLMNIVPQLEQQAYGRHQGDLQNSRSNLNSLLDLDNDAYRKAVDSRSFGYGMDRDAIADSRYADETQYNRGIDTRNFDYGVKRDAVGDEQWRSSFDETVRSNKDSSARGWASHNLGKDQFEWNKSTDARDYDYKVSQDKLKKIAEETKTDPQNLGAFYSSMMQSEDPAKFLAKEALHLTNDELIAIQKLLPKQESELDRMILGMLTGVMTQK